MEETRSEITFATEPIISSLTGSLSSARVGGVLDGVDLDEVEVSSVNNTSLLGGIVLTKNGFSSLTCLFPYVQIQKGILQVAQGLSFLHSQAKLMHNNISPGEKCSLFAADPR